MAVSCYKGRLGAEMDSRVRLYGSQSLAYSVFGPFKKKKKILSSVPVHYNQIKRTKIIYNLFMSSVLIGRIASLSWINIYIKYNGNTIIYFFKCNKRSNCVSAFTVQIPLYCCLLQPISIFALFRQIILK